MVQSMQRQSNQGQGAQQGYSQQGHSQQGHSQQGHGSHNPPAEVFRFGGVSLTIFENQTTREGQVQKFWKAKVDKRYRDSQSGEWKSTSSYSTEELLRLRALIDRGIQFMMDKPGE